MRSARFLMWKQIRLRGTKPYWSRPKDFVSILPWKVEEFLWPRTVAWQGRSRHLQLRREENSGRTDSGSRDTSETTSNSRRIVAQRGASPDGSKDSAPA